MRYYVKWKDANGTHYGVHEYNQDDAKPGMSLVSDAVLPTLWNVPTDSLEDIEANYDMDEDGNFKDEFFQYVQREWVKADKRSKEATSLVGKLFGLGVADGLAWYVVTKENKKTARVEWRGFCPDRWTDQVLGYGGTFEKDRIACLVR